MKILCSDFFRSSMDVLPSYQVSFTNHNTLLTIILVSVLHIFLSNQFLHGSISHYHASLICVFQVEFQVMLPQLFNHLAKKTIRNKLKSLKVAK